MPSESVSQASAQSLEAAHRHLLANRDLQFDFRKIPPPSKPPGWLVHLMQALGKAFEWAAPAMKYVFWTGVVLVVLFLLYLIARETGLLNWTRRPKRTRPLDLHYRPQEGVALALLADADALAAEGRYAEAVHTLLLRSIEDMRAWRPRAIQPALTSRDIAVLETLPEPARPAFAAMAGMVETSLFGGAAVDAGGFSACRRAYEDFAFPKVWA
jgi:hypothetical protein